MFFRKISLCVIFCVMSFFANAQNDDQEIQAENKNKPPNIIIIMTDDMGYSDIACYGGEIATPTLDALAKNGLRYRQMYNTSKCMTTR